MKKTLWFLALTGLSAVPAAAAPIVEANFCPGNVTCPAGITEASLAFTEDMTTMGDLNDYQLEVMFSGSAISPAYLDEFSFTIGGVKTSSGYEALPTVIGFSAGSGWTSFFDNVSANADSCTSNTNASNEVCVQSGPGDALNFGAALPNQTITFNLYVDLAGDGLGEDDVMLTSSSILNLRAQFLDADGNNAGILSPNSRDVTAVPEPASLLLLGSGLIGAGLRARRKKKR